MDLFGLSSVVTEHDVKKAGAEECNIERAHLPTHPDEEYFKVDAQFRGMDQRKIFAPAKEVLLRVGFRERAHLMNPMAPGLQDGKISIC
jgi:tyrosyl-tRNA synthetase